MNAGQKVIIGGRTAEVIKVRKTAPVAVVEFDDGSTDLHWFGDTEPPRQESGPVRGPKVKTGGFADAWTQTHILGPINTGPSSDELTESWGLAGTSPEPHETDGSDRVADIPVQSPSLASHSPETPMQAQWWKRTQGWYERAGLCPRCSSQGAWGHQLGFSNVKPPCNPCAAIVAEFPTPSANGWHQLTQHTAPQYALTAAA